MRKLSALRQYLIDAVPDLKRDPDRLLTFIEDGSVQFSRGSNLSHGYRFTAQLILTDYAGEIDAIMLPLLDWLSIYQPDLEPEQAVSFEAEILNNDAVDLALRVRLDERVVAKRDCESGRITAEHRMPRFERPDCPGVKWTLEIRERLGGDFVKIAEWETAGVDDGLY